MACALSLTVLDSEDWFLPELQPTLQVEYISACSQLQNYSTQKRKKPKQSQCFNVSIFFHIVSEELLLSSCKANRRMLEGPQSV